MNLSQRDPPRAFTAAARRAAPLPLPLRAPYVHRRPDHVRRRRRRKQHVCAPLEERGKGLRLTKRWKKTQYVCVCVSVLILVMINKIFLELFEAQVIIDIPMILLVVAGLSSSFNLEPGTG